MTLKQKFLDMSSDIISDMKTEIESLINDIKDSTDIVIIQNRLNILRDYIKFNNDIKNDITVYSRDIAMELVEMMLELESK